MTKALTDEASPPPTTTAAGQPETAQGASAAKETPKPGTSGAAADSKENMIKTCTRFTGAALQLAKFILSTNFF